MLITSSPRLRRCATLSAAGLGALVLGACGADGGGASSDSDSAAERDAARIKLNDCLRRNGVDVQDDPGPGGGGSFRVRADRGDVEKAMNGPCKKLREAAFGQISEQDRQEFEDAFQRFAQCMREHGVDLPDPTTSSSSGGGGPSRSSVRIDRDDPDFQAAEKACGDKLPKGRPGGGFITRGGGGAK